MISTQPGWVHFFQYGILALPLAFAGLPLYLHIPDYYIRDMGLSLGAVGIMLMVLRLLDTVQDPVLGYLSDRWAMRRSVFVYAGSCALLLGMGALLIGPPSMVQPLFWLGGAMMLASLGLSAISINLNMIGGLWYQDSATRVRLSSWREASGLIGLLLAAILPPVLQRFYSPSESFDVLFFIFSVLFLTSFYCFFRTLKSIPQDHIIFKENHERRFFFLPTVFLYEKKFYLICFLTHLAASFPAVLFLFFARDYLQAGSYSGLFLILYFLSGVLFMPVWSKIARTTCAPNAWLISMGIACLSFIWAFLLSPGDIVLFAIICILSGLALGADLALPPVILAEKISGHHAEAAASQNYALLNLMPKLALAMASGIAFLVLAYASFIPGEVNTTQSLFWLTLLYALLPSCIKAIAALILWHNLNTKGDYHEHFQRSHSNGINHVT